MNGLPFGWFSFCKDPCQYGHNGLCACVCVFICGLLQMELALGLLLYKKNINLRFRDKDVFLFASWGLCS